MEAIYSIKQVSEKTGISIGALHYYEHEGLIWDIVRLPNGHRRYSEQNIAWIEFLNCMRDSGMPIRDLRQYVQLTRQNEANKERCAILEAHRDSIKSQIKALEAYLNRVESKIRWFEDTFSFE